MKVCFINGWSQGSTGNIVYDLANKLLKEGSESIFITRGKVKDKSVFKSVLELASNSFSYYVPRFFTFIFGNDGFGNIIQTKKALNFLKKNKPDIVHIINAHSGYINIGKIIKYCKKNNVKIIWSVVDLWLLTGRCACFLNCSKWKKGCKYCNHTNYYPKSFLGFCNHQFKKKRSILKEKITFVVPSKWVLDSMRTASNINDIRILNFGVDKHVFYPISNSNSLINRKNIVGCAAFNMSKEKGFDFVVKLSEQLDKNTVIVCIGANVKKSIFINENLMLLPRVYSKKEMSEFYSSIKVFLNPTYSDTYSMTNLEALSCGIPVISFNTGGAIEMLQPNNSIIVDQDDLVGTKKAIDYFLLNQPTKEEISRTVKNLSIDYYCDEFYQIYSQIVK